MPISTQQVYLRQEGKGGDLEAKVRKVLPKDEQIVAAMVGVYFSLFMVSKLARMGGSKKPEPVPVVATASALVGSTSKFGFEPPSIETFDAWSENAENWKKWEEFMSGPKLDLYLDGKL